MVSVFTVGKSEDGLREGAGDPEPGCVRVHACTCGCVV